jgi:hypothetical protein
MLSPTAFEPQQKLKLQGVSQTTGYSHGQKLTIMYHRLPFLPPAIE